MAESKSAALPLGYAPPERRRTLPSESGSRKRRASRRHGDVVAEPGVGLGEALAQLRLGVPAERGEAAHIEQLLRRAVGPRRIEFDLARPADHGGDLARQLGDGEVAAGADVEVAL